MKNLETYAEKLNWFLNDLLHHQLIPKAYLLRAEPNLLPENIIPSPVDMTVSTKRYAFKEKQIHEPFTHLICMHFNSLILGREQINTGREVCLSLIPIRNLCVLFQLICLRDIDFKCESIFFNSALNSERETAQYRNLKQQQTILLNQELERFLALYPDLFNLSQAVKSLNLDVLRQLEILLIVKNLNEQILALFEDFCKNLQTGVPVNKTILMFHILKDANARYFFQTGCKEWRSDQFQQNKKVLELQILEQETFLIGHVKGKYKIRFSDYFLKNKEIFKLNQELFPHCSAQQFEKDYSDLLGFIQ
ncbi:MAG: hypothetical protein RSB22_07640 [Acinetobacter sp.]